MNKTALLIAFISVIACQDPEKKIPTQESIANTYGYSNWKNVNELTFTFNVDRDTTHFERTFIWEPKSKKVTYISVSDTVQFLQDSIKRVSLAADKSFVNDKYWLLAPFQLVWDQGTTFSEKENVVAPISKEKMKVLTMTYPAEGGYTPGDAYDFYYDNDFLIKEWAYRPKNQPEPSMVTTWENIQEVNGIKMATMHKDSTGNFKLYFTNLSIQ
ncbi:MAG: hypothetical protein R2781_11810 [Flavobacteriaceae bacterium]